MWQCCTWWASVSNFEIRTEEVCSPCGNVSITVRSFNVRAASCLASLGNVPLPVLSASESSAVNNILRRPANAMERAAVSTVRTEFGFGTTPIAATLHSDAVRVATKASIDFDKLSQFERRVRLHVFLSACGHMASSLQAVG